MTAERLAVEEALACLYAMAAEMASVGLVKSSATVFEHLDVVREYVPCVVVEGEKP